MEITCLTVIRARKPSEESSGVTVTVVSKEGKYDAIRLDTAKDVSRLIDLLKPYAEDQDHE